MKPRDVLDVERTNLPLSDDSPDTNPIMTCEVSPKVACKLRSNEITAFVPMTATDLVWAEALAMDPEAGWDVSAFLPAQRNRDE